MYCTSANPAHRPKLTLSTYYIQYIYHIQYNEYMYDIKMLIRTCYPYVDSDSLWFGCSTVGAESISCVISISPDRI